jgi:hypothetical protein
LNSAAFDAAAIESEITNISLDIDDPDSVPANSNYPYIGDIFAALIP